MLATGRLTPDRVLRHRIEMDGGRTFLVWENAGGICQEITYASFGERVSRTATGLSRLGIGEGDRVVIHMGNRPEFLVSLFAIHRLGAIAVPTIALYAADELRYVIEHAEVATVICDPGRREVVQEVATEVGTLKHLVCTDSPENLESGWSLFAEVVDNEARLDPSPARAEDIALIMYSSGTTARPKGIQISHGMSVFSGECNAQHQRLQPTDRTMCVLPLFHANAMFISTMATFVTGAREVLIEKFIPSRYWDQIRTYRVTVGSLVANPIKQLLAEPANPGDGIHELRFMLYGLALKDEDISMFEERFRVPLINLWGMTEDAATGTRSPLYLPRKPDKVGLPMLGYQIEVTDDDGKDLQLGEPGEVRFRAGAVTDGYYKNDTATAAAFDGEWFKTGDTMAFDDDGYLTFVDRRKDVIKVKGENVASSEVERVLSDHPSVVEVAVIGMPDPIRDEQIVALIVTKEGVALSEDEVRDHCRKYLARFKIPHRIRFVDSLPKTSIGKIQKGELRKSLVRQA